MTKTQRTVLEALAAGSTITISAVADRDALLVGEEEKKPVAARTFQALHKAGYLEPLPKTLRARRRYGISKAGKEAIGHD